jgi:uncharacterized protein (TIGR02001 family)
LCSQAIYSLSKQKGNPMKKLILASAISAAFVGSFAQAEEAAAPEHVLTYNLGVTSDYVFRGISQSRNRAAFSGGVDYSHTPTGLYAGTWVSTISWVNDSDTGTSPSGRGNTPYEQDFYAGIKGEIGGGLSYDVGAIYYYYPGHKLKALSASGGLDANTTEVYGKVGYGPVYFKYSYAVGDAIWVSDKAGSYYLDLGADVPVMDGLVFNAHVGRFVFKQDTVVLTSTAYNYSDWKVGLTKDFGNGFTGAIAATGTNADKTNWNFQQTGYLGGTKGIVTLTKTF